MKKAILSLGLVLTSLAMGIPAPRWETYYYVVCETERPVNYAGFVDRIHRYTSQPHRHLKRPLSGVRQYLTALEFVVPSHPNELWHATRAAAQAEVDRIRQLPLAERPGEPGLASTFDATPPHWTAETIDAPAEQFRRDDTFYFARRESLRYFQYHSRSFDPEAPLEMQRALSCEVVEAIGARSAGFVITASFQELGNRRPTF